MLALTPETISPPALVQAAFDEARALAECKELIERRDDAQGEVKEAFLLLGQKLIQARRAMPGTMKPNGTEKYSPTFLAFIDKVGLTLATARRYMSFARDPKRLEANRAHARKRGSERRVRVLKEVVELLAQAPDLETARRVIQEELNEIK